MNWITKQWPLCSNYNFNYRVQGVPDRRDMSANRSSILVGLTPTNGGQDPQIVSRQFPFQIQIFDLLKYIM